MKLEVRFFSKTFLTTNLVMNLVALLFIELVHFQKTYMINRAKQLHKLCSR